MRLWDIALITGRGRKTVLRGGLAVVSLGQSRLLEAPDADSFMSIFSSLPRTCVDADLLIQHATHTVGSLPKSFLGARPPAPALLIFSQTASHGIWAGR